MAGAHAAAERERQLPPVQQIAVVVAGNAR